MQGLSTKIFVNLETVSFFDQFQCLKPLSFHSGFEPSLTFESSTISATCQPPHHVLLLSTFLDQVVRLVRINLSKFYHMSHSHPMLISSLLRLSPTKLYHSPNSPQFRSIYVDCLRLPIFFFFSESTTFY